MKKFLYKLLFLILSVFNLSSCYDDSELRNKVDNHEERLQSLENLCRQINTNISSLQSIIEAIQKNDYITSITPIQEGNDIIGYTINFTQSGAITIYHGEDGETPVIAAKLDENGVYYWTIDGEWVKDEQGNKIPTTGTDGENGTTPYLKIEDGYWYVSYDNGTSWQLLYKAVGEDGVDGDSFFKEVIENDYSVIFILSDGSELELLKYRQGKATLLSFGFTMLNNPSVLLYDISCEIKENNVIDCRIPYIVETKTLIPTFTFVGENVKINNEIIDSDTTKVDFSRPVTVIVEDKYGYQEYTINVYAFTGLPIIRINTEGYEDVVSKDEYLKGSFELVEDILTKGYNEVVSYDVKIKGRGNSTWGLPKKPYKIKFSEKVSLLGEPEEKSWLLLANYTDKTFLRNSTAFYMGIMSNLSYTTKSHFVELFLNERYRGTYLLCEDKDVSEKRINISKDGYLLEIDAKAAEEDVTFNISSIGMPINIKEPEILKDSEEYNLVKNYLLTVEEVLFSESFADKETGYSKYIDVNSFIDWYLINEISKNNDAIFYSSCYMTYEPGGKLYMGPLWDFDIAFGNVNYNNCQFPEGFYIKNVKWYSRLFEDPLFIAKVKDRFDYFYNNQNEILAYINSCADYLQYSMLENNAVWGTLYQATWPNFAVLGNYENEVQYLKSFFLKRMEWLKKEFEQM